MNEPDMIYIIGNPYPNRRTLEKFKWSGRINEDETMWFDLHLETDAYHFEEFRDKFDEREDAIIDWDTKTDEDSFVTLTMSSTYWPDEGIQINKKTSKTIFNDLIKEPLLAHTLPVEKFNCNEVAFGVYFYGHDSCANHKITIRETGKNKFDIQWSGKIALSYFGEYEFKHPFNFHLPNAEFDGFHYPKNWSLEKASDYFKAHFDDFDEYEFC